MNGYQAYKYFMAVKLHFTTEKYDLFEKRGRVSGTQATFEKRNDRGLFEKLADDLSRATFLEAIALRRTGRPEFLRSVTPGDQYFPAGVPIPRTGVRFVDGGAFDGDTIAHLIEAGFVFEGIAAFEPDPTSSFRRVGGLGYWRMRGSGFAMAATNGWNPMLKTEQTPRPRTPTPQLLTDPRQVDTLLRRPSAPKRFGGCSSGKSRFFKSTLT